MTPASSSCRVPVVHDHDWLVIGSGFGGSVILRLTVFKDVFVGSGAGVGGGSLGYANTLHRAPRRFYDDPQWAGLSADWGAELAPHYDTAERMLGVADVPTGDPADDLLREFGRELGVGDTYSKTRVGVYADARQRDGATRRGGRRAAPCRT